MREPLCKTRGHFDDHAKILCPNVKKERERLLDLWRGEVSEPLLSQIKSLH